MKKFSVYFILFVIAFSFSSCELEKDTITVYNDTWDYIDVVVDGGAPIAIPYDRNATFEVDDLANVYVTAIAYGPYGEVVECKVYEENAETFGVSVPENYFYLQILHNKEGRAGIDRLRVNVGNGDETDETIDPALVYGATNSYTHYIGYYRANSSCKIIVDAGNKSDWWIESAFPQEEYDFSYPDEENQAVLLETTDLIYLKKHATVKSLVKQRVR